MAAETTGGHAFLIDWVRLRARVDNDEDFLRELCTMFLEDAPARAATLEKAMGSGDLKTAASMAHSLKGICGAVNAPRLVDLALFMELAGRAGDASLLAAHYAEFAVLLQQAVDDIRSRLSL